ncbi:MAG: 4Fe-4S binding protein [Chloroflexota bacterium]|nr:4Fe-4S binding protein [Chloroflexota bacterium]
MSQTTSEDIYRKLAQRLDAIPNGFPATESGVELRLLAKIFAPEEAALASVMRLTSEPAADIAARAGVERRAAWRTLKQMVRRGLIRVKKGDRHLVFGLMPFAVGLYEEQLKRMDEEMALLFERYYQEIQGSILHDAPSVHRVIPVEEAIPFDLEIFPYEQATEMLENARSWGVRDCICRVQQRLIGKGCDHEIENCLVLASTEGTFVNSEITRAISKEEALHILRETEEAGLVHSTGNYRDAHSYICNCCTCCCGILRGVAEFGIPTAIAHSGFRAVVDAEECIGCEDCIARCQFGALAVPEDICVVDYARCVGCGVCVLVCPAGALNLARRPEDETASLPVDNEDWMARRAQERGIRLEEVL